MVDDFVGGLCSVLYGASAFMTFLSLALAIASLLQSAARRRDGISVIAALASRNVLFRPELYTEAASRPRHLHLLGLMGTILFSCVTLAVGLLLE